MMKKEEIKKLLGHEQIMEVQFVVANKINLNDELNDSFENMVNDMDGKWSHSITNEIVAISKIHAFMDKERNWCLAWYFEYFGKFFINFYGRDIEGTEKEILDEYMKEYGQEMKEWKGDI